MGRAVKRYSRREHLQIATKVWGRMHDGPTGAGLSAPAIREQLDASLARLDTDYIDLYYIHRFDAETPVEETMEALHAAVTAGKVRALGASSMTGERERCSFAACVPTVGAPTRWGLLPRKRDTYRGEKSGFDQRHVGRFKGESHVTHQATSGVCSDDDRSRVGRRVAHRSPSRRSELHWLSVRLHVDCRSSKFTKGLRQLLGACAVHRVWIDCIQRFRDDALRVAVSRNQYSAHMERFVRRRAECQFAERRADAQLLRRRCLRILELDDHLTPYRLESTWSMRRGG